MKKMFLLPLTVGLLLVGCKKENVAPQQQTTQQSTDGKKPIVDVQAKAFGTQTQSYTVGPVPKILKFQNVVVTGNNTIQISVSNTGTDGLNISLQPSGSFGSTGIISLPSVPNGGGVYHTFVKPISGWSGYVKVYISTVSGSVFTSATGNIIVTSF